AVRLGRRKIALLVRISIQIVELVDPRTEIEQVFPVVLANAEYEPVFGHIKICSRWTRGIEQAASQPVRRRRHAYQAGDRRGEVDLAANRRRARCRPVETREPEHQRNMNVFFVCGAALAVGRVWIAKGLPVIADDDDEGILVETGMANRIEESGKVTIGFVQDVEI